MSLLKVLLDGLGIGTSPWISSLAIASVAIDSRAVTQGALFCAYPGYETDGRHYIHDAVLRGAVAVLYENADHFDPPMLNVPCIGVAQLRQKISALAGHFYNHPSQQLTIVGVTGTNGKTSICHFTAQLLQALGHRCAVLGTVGNGIWPDLLPSARTTHDAVMLQKCLREYCDAGVNYVVIEVSSHALEQDRVAAIAFDVAVFSNLTRDHLDYHADMTQYAAAKSRLFAMPTIKHAVINMQDPYAEVMLQALPRAAVQSSFQTSNISWPKGLTQAKFQQSNALQAASVLKALGFSEEMLLPLLSQLHTVEGRLELASESPMVLIDYAHTPDGIAQVLAAVCKNISGELWVIFGCGGDRDRGKRPIMANIVEQFADHVIVTTDNPRFESPKQIFDDIFQGFLKPEKTALIENRAQAIEWALEQMQADDTLLLLGKGHERYQDVRGQKIAFDERTIVRQCLKQKV